MTKWPSNQWPSDQLYPVVIVMKCCIVVVCTLKKFYHQVKQVSGDQVTKWPSDQWPSAQLYPVVIAMKLYKVVVCTPKKVYYQVTKGPSDQWKTWWTISSKLIGKFKGEDVLLPRIPMIPTKYGFRVQTFAISCATRFCNDHQQSTRTIGKSVWMKFGKTMLLTWTTVCSLLTRSDLFVYTPEGKNKNIVYSEDLQ
jgi:hypothetical protein